LRGDPAKLDRIATQIRGITWSNGGHASFLLRDEVDATLSLGPEEDALTLSYVADRPRSVQAMLRICEALEARGLPCTATRSSSGAGEGLVVINAARARRSGQVPLFALIAALASVAVVALSLIEVHTRDRVLRLTETMASLPLRESELRRVRFVSVWCIIALAVLGFALAATALQTLFHAPAVRVSMDEIARGTWLVLLQATAALSLMHGIIIRLPRRMNPEAVVLLLVPLLIGGFAIGATQIQLPAFVAALLPFVGTGRLSAPGAAASWGLLALHAIPIVIIAALALRNRVHVRTSRSPGPDREGNAAFVLAAITWTLGFTVSGLGASYGQDLRLRAIATLLLGLLFPVIPFAIWRARRIARQERIRLREHPPEYVRVDGGERRQHCSFRRALWISACAALAIVCLLPMLRALSTRYFGQLPAVVVPDGISAVLAFAILPALIEEFVFRGVLLRAWQRRGLGWAIMLSSVVFALHHYHLARLPGSFVAGLAFAWVACRTRSWLFAAVAHLMVNLAGLLEFGSHIQPGVGALVGMAALMLLIAEGMRRGGMTRALFGSPA
jgi:membrane protease YdiL (CAAX protease family)